MTPTIHDLYSRPNPSLIRVFRIPPPTGEFCFTARAVEFVEVDWFQDPDNMMSTEDGREMVREFVEAKTYADDGSALLVMSPLASFTIDYTGARHPRITPRR